MDPYFKKEIIYPYVGQKFIFEVGETLFSTFSIDHGTDILIRAIESNNPKSILDIGCGYGPLGIILAKNNPQADVIMVDRDLLAVKYSNLNIIKNNISNAKAFGSLGVEEFKDKKFDLIVSNVPAKIGDEAITQQFVLQPYEQLNPNGEYWLVVVSGLNHLIPRLGGKYNLKIEFVRKRKGHTVYKIKKISN